MFVNRFIANGKSIGYRDFLELVKVPEEEPLKPSSFQSRHDEYTCLLCQIVKASRSPKQVTARGRFIRR